MARVVVVEDDRMQRELYEVALSRSGDLEVVGRFGDVPEALAWDGWRDVDVVLCDWQLPHASGDVLLEWLSQHHPHVRRILITASPDRAVRKGGAAVAHRVIAKPSQVRDIEEAVRGG